jgi:hypothetical protein
VRGTARHRPPAGGPTPHTAERYSKFVKSVTLLNQS